MKEEHLARSFLQQPDQLVELRTLLVRVAAVDRGLDAMLRVVFQDQLFHPEDRGSDRRRLYKDIHAVAIRLDHPDDTPDLPFKAG